MDKRIKMIKDNLINIEGVFVKELSQFKDERGSVMHMIKSNDSNFTKFGEIYFSEILPEKIKAWKYHKTQSQNIAVPIGNVKFVIYDDRVNSRTYKNLLEIELGRPNSYFLLHIPPGLWYGFKSKCFYPSLIVNCSETPHDKDESLRRDLKDDFITIDWSKI
jgi:dTDP-4-dehydrorhamnose 3,5-epimerase